MSHAILGWHASMNKTNKQKIPAQAEFMFDDGSRQIGKSMKQDK